MRGISFAGSPLLPTSYLIGIGLGLFVLLGVIYLIIHSLSGHHHPRTELKRFVFWSFLTIASILIYIGYLLVQSPKVIATTPASGEEGVSLGATVSVEFSEPVSRIAMEKSITPDVPGIWIFEDPVYETHLYRKVAFYPDLGFDSGTEYKVKLANISDTIRVGKKYDYEFSFKTKVAPPKETAVFKKVKSETVKLNVPAYLQEHTLSCELSSLKMTLAYKGIAKSEIELLNQVGIDNTPHTGGTWGNPYEKFVGNVNGRQMRDGYGVYWGPIARVAQMYGRAEAFQNGDVTKITSNIKEGNPVIIWVYSTGGIPTKWKTPSGLEVYAVTGEHTVVAVGFVGSAEDPSQIIVNDSLVGQVYWSRALFDKKWSVFNKSGVVVYK